MWARIETSSADTGSSSTMSRGVGGERPRDREPLALPAAELVREQAAPYRAHPDQLQQLVDPRLHLLARQRLVGLQRLGDDLAHPHARAERAVGVLEHDLDLAPIAPAASSGREAMSCPSNSMTPGSRPLGGKHQL